jgi:hypothetical protein
MSFHNLEPDVVGEAVDSNFEIAYEIIKSIENGPLYLRYSEATT